MTKRFLLFAVALLASLCTAHRAAAEDNAPDPNFYIYLCLGQSNMEGYAGYDDFDTRNVPDRFMVMGVPDWGNSGREKGKWYTAVPPLVRETAGIGPSDYFGRTMVANLPEEVRVGVIPVAVGGAPIFMLSKDYVLENDSWREDVKDDKINSYGGNPFNRLVEMGKIAKTQGVIKGVLFHQGCGNHNDPAWPGNVRDVYNELLRQLELDAEDVPLFAGEVVYAEAGGPCSSHNTLVNKLPEYIPTCHIISAAGIPSKPGDTIHFSKQGYRILGQRYAEAALKLMGINDIDLSDPNVEYLKGLYADTKALIPEGVDISKAEEAYENAKNSSDYYTALGWLRSARRRAAARRIDDTFEGAPQLPKGDFYLYNVGQRQFYDAGGDWAVHPILDAPGVKFKAMGVNRKRTACKLYNYNTTERHYLASWLSLDGSDNHTWTFRPVEGQTNTFFFTDENGAIGYVDQPADNNTTFCETNMWKHAKGTYDPADPNFWWKYVTPEERDKAVAAATVSNPADASHVIDNPGFNVFLPRDKWVSADVDWYGGYNGSGWCCAQSGGQSTDMSLIQEIPARALPSGVYEVECQGLYRNSDHRGQASAEAVSHAALVAGADVSALTENNSVLLPNIMDEANMAPGEGGTPLYDDDGNLIEYPEVQDQCGYFYRAGLYKRRVVINFDASDDATLKIGVKCDGTAGPAGSYVQADNFRLKYYGPAQQTVNGKLTDVLELVKNGGQSGVEPVATDASAAPADNRVYNLQGILISDTSAPGIYICNGKKFIVR